MSDAVYIACDLGAESGRVILGQLRGGRIDLEEIHRFPNGAIRIQGSLRWDVLRIFDEIKAALRKIGAQRIPARSISVDSWGLDYVLTGQGQPLLSHPYCYRDARSDEPFSAAQVAPGRAAIFAETGIQFLPINTLYHLIAENRSSPGLLAAADGFLLIADYFHYLLSGVSVAEESLASTTQLFHPVRHAWSIPLIDRFQLPRHLFPRLVRSGTRLGPLLNEIASEVDLPGIAVVATCSHDTGAAVAAVPADPADDWAYLSSGTWSLIGVELNAPLMNEAALRHNFTNEAGFGGTTRFLKNIVGLWLLQECRRSWRLAGREFSYADLAESAKTAQPFRSLIDPADPRFLKPDEMPAKIAQFCVETAQPVPELPGQFTRCIYESLAMLYRRTLDEIEAVTGRTIKRLHIVGGGSQAALLNEFAAAATGRQVVTGPVEATALGNIALQAYVDGRVADLDEIRQVVRRSTPVEEIEPTGAVEWSKAYDRFERLAKR